MDDKSIHEDPRYSQLLAMKAARMGGAAPGNPPSETMAMLGRPVSLPR